MEIEWKDYLRVFEVRMWLLVIGMVALLAITDIVCIWAMQIHHLFESSWIIYDRIFHYFQTIFCYQGKKIQLICPTFNFHYSIQLALIVSIW